MQPLSEEFWDYCYIHGMAGWDIKQLSPAVRNYLDTITDPHAAILSPACGRAYEADYLLGKGFDNITLIDISSVLVNELKATFAGKPVRILHEDFYSHQGQYDLILEQAFFCTVAPADRDRFIAHVYEMLLPGGRYAGLFFNERVGSRNDPPYTLDIDGYRDLFSDRFEIKRLEPCLDSIESRKEKEIIFEFVKKCKK
ncbi:MAG: methyltransferase domain-containing protein [Chitinophagaceae bacterium]|nr:methyltransferase domain-containing protein [Chitinophagaceae bacterium]